VITQLNIWKMSDQIQDILCGYPNTQFEHYILTSFCI